MKQLTGVKTGTKKTVTKVAVDPTKALKESIAELQATLQASRDHNRALQSYLSNAEMLKSGFAAGLRAERADLMARVDRIDSRLTALDITEDDRNGAQMEVTKRPWQTLKDPRE